VNSFDSATITALWQLDATVVTVGVALLLFVLQGYAGRTPGTSLQLLAADSGLLPYLHLGVITLLVLGLELISKSAPVVGIAMSAAIVVGLATFVSASVQVISSESSLERTFRALEAATNAAIVRIRFEGIATHILGARLSDLAIAEDHPFGLPVTPIMAPKDGVVYDVSLNRLDRLADLGYPAWQVALTVKIGTAVTRGSAIGYIPAGAGIAGAVAVLQAVQIVKAT
jgi:hypothetical protein